MKYVTKVAVVIEQTTEVGKRHGVKQAHYILTNELKKTREF